MNTNKYLGGLIVVAWLLLIVDFVGDRLIPPMEPVVSKATAQTGPVDKEPAKSTTSEQPLNVLLASASIDKGKKVAKTRLVQIFLTLSVKPGVPSLVLLIPVPLKLWAVNGGLTT